MNLLPLVDDVNRDRSKPQRVLLSEFRNFKVESIIGSTVTTNKLVMNFALFGDLCGVFWQEVHFTFEVDFDSDKFVEYHEQLIETYPDFNLVDLVKIRYTSRPIEELMPYSLAVDESTMQMHCRDLDLSNKQDLRTLCCHYNMMILEISREQEIVKRHEFMHESTEKLCEMYEIRINELWKRMEELDDTESSDDSSSL